MSVKCSNTECKHQFSGKCCHDGEIDLTVVSDMGELLCQDFEYNGEELYGWDTSIVDDVVRRYEEYKMCVVSDEYDEPTKSRPFWAYGLEDGGYLQVIPTTDISVRLEQYLDEQIVCRVVYRDFVGFRDIE